MLLYFSGLYDDCDICETSQAWFETGAVGIFGDSTWGSATAASSTFSFKGASSTFSYKGTGSAGVGQENKLESTYLYIQMEFCPRYRGFFTSIFSCLVLYPLLYSLDDFSSFIFVG